MPQITCPRCNHQMNGNIRRCENCDVDLALAAAIAENMILSTSSIQVGVSVSPELLLPRLGEYLLEKGVLDQSGLDKGLTYQREKANIGQPILIGQALMELGLLDRSSLDEAITEQIFYLQNALQESNQELEIRVQERTSELQNALKKLNEINQIKSNFIANISHELRTPLTHIKGYIDLLADGSLGSLSSNQVEALNVLQRSEKRLERTIDDLIQFTLAARGELAIEISNFELGPLIRSTISRFANQAMTKNLSVQTMIPDDLPPVLADEEKIGWVLMQLLDNAIKFTHSGGKIEVSTRKENKFIYITVSDTGIGIPEESIPEIFEVFHQLDSSTTRRYSGTGLGLSLVNRVLDAHGFTLEVKSKPGSGSIFEFSLPIGNLNDATSSS
jgi:signal transduction histidine kinase